MLPVEFSPSALGDLEQMLDYYSAQGAAEAGRRIAKEMMAAVRALPDYPHMGRIVPEFGTTSLRELIRPPFRIVYRLESERIAVIRIWRCERLLNMPDEA